MCAIVSFFCFFFPSQTDKKKKVLVFIQMNWLLSSADIYVRQAEI